MLTKVAERGIKKQLVSIITKLTNYQIFKSLEEPANYWWALLIRRIMHPVSRIPSTSPLPPFGGLRGLFPQTKSLS